MNQSYREVDAIRRQIEASEGWRIVKKLRRLNTSYYVLSANYRDLKNALLVFNQPDVAIDLWQVNNRAKLELFMKEVIRLVHNYLAAVMSLVDHTRKLARELYANTDFWEEYQREITKRFAESPHSQFVQDLRDYVLHKELPFVRATLRWERGAEMKNRIHLDVSRLRSWKRWRPKSKEYLAGLSGDVDLETVIDQYMSTVTDFYEWFKQRQKELHRRELQELAQLQARLNEAQERAAQSSEPA